MNKFTPIFLVFLMACPGSKSECDSAKASAKLACCDLPASPGPSGVSLPTSCACDEQGHCSASDFINVPCMPLAASKGGESEASCPDPAKVDSNPCKSALSIANTQCGESPLDLGGGSDGATVSAVCEALEEWKGAFTCGYTPADCKEGFNPNQTTGVAPKCKPEYFPPGTEGPLDTAFGGTPDVPWTEPKSDPSAPNDPATPPELPESVALNLNRGSSLFRLEVPGNFMRFYTAQMGLAGAFAELGQQPGVSCNVDALRCQLDVMNMQDLTTQLSQHPDAKGNGLSATATKEGDHYRLDDISFAAKHPDGINVSATFSGSVKIDAKGKLDIDLRNRGSLDFVPMHDPDQANGYDTSLSLVDAHASDDDRAMLVTQLSSEDCHLLSALKVDGTNLNGQYTTFASPYVCRCDDAKPSNNYCVGDVFPRATHVLRDEAEWLNYWSFSQQPPEPFVTQRHYVLCSMFDDSLSPEIAALNPYTLMLDARPIEQAFKAPTAKTLAALYQALPYLGIEDDATRQQLVTDAELFGCSKRHVKFTAVNASPAVKFPPLVASATGVRADVNIRLPTIIATTSNGLVLVDFDLGVNVDKWFKSKWYLGWLGWLLKWIMKVFAGILSAIASALEIVFSGDAIVDFGDQDVHVDAVLSHRDVVSASALALVPQIEVGVRRVSSSLPHASLVPFDPMPKWNNNGCKFDDLSSVPGWAVALIGCPADVAINLAKFAVAPVLSFLKLLTNALLDLFLAPSDLVSAKVMKVGVDLEKQNNIAKLFGSAARTVLLLPYAMDKNGKGPAALNVDVIALTPAQAATRTAQDLPPPLDVLCLGARASTLACTLTKMFIGSGDRLEPQVLVKRMGAKTHYRSLPDTLVTPLDYKLKELSWDLPPVRYCVAGDNAPAQGEPPLDVLRQLKEVRQSAADDPAPLDWRSQCALFADFEINGHYTINVGGTGTIMEIDVSPTKRTNFLINEVFVCESSQSCSPKQEPIRDRADLAMCSIAADLRVRACTPAAGCSAWKDLVSLAANPELVSTAHAYLTAILGLTHAPAAWQKDVWGFVDLLGQCDDKLAAAGFALP